MTQITASQIVDGLREVPAEIFVDDMEIALKDGEIEKGGLLLAELKESLDMAKTNVEIRTKLTATNEPGRKRELEGAVNSDEEVQQIKASISDVKAKIIERTAELKEDKAKRDHVVRQFSALLASAELIAAQYNLTAARERKAAAELALVSKASG